MKSLYYITLSLFFVALMPSSALSTQSNVYIEPENSEYIKIESPLKVNKNYSNPTVSKLLDDPVYFDYDPSILSKLSLVSNSKISIEIPLIGHNSKTMTLYLQEVKPEFYTCPLYTGKNERYTGSLPQRLHFTGTVMGKKNSTVAISFLEKEIIGIISIKNQPPLTIGKLNGENSVHSIYKESELHGVKAFKCHTPNEDYSDRDNSEPTINTRSGNGGNNCIDLDFDVKNK